MKEYPTLTALMQGREPGSVKVRKLSWLRHWVRPGTQSESGKWNALDNVGNVVQVEDDGPWLLVSEDQPALDMVRLEVAVSIAAGLAHNGRYVEEVFLSGGFNSVEKLRERVVEQSFAWADALLAEARK